MHRRNLVPILLLGLGISMVPGVGAEAQGLFSPASCEARVPPEVGVRTNSVGYVIDHSRTHDEISDLARGGNIAFGVAQYAPGLTTADIVSRADYAMTSVQMRDGAWCSTLDSVTIDIGLAAPATVYVEKALAPSTCAYGAVLRHELMHVAAFERTIREGPARIVASVGAFVDARMPVGVAPDVQESRDALIAEAQRIVDLAVRSVVDFGIRLNAEVDSPAEYAAVQASCDDWVR